MKRKNWMLVLFLSVVILPCIALLTACGNAKVTGFSVYLGQTLVAENTNKISATYGDNIDLEKLITVKLIYDDGEMEVISKGTGGYTILDMPEVFSAGKHIVKVKYGDFESISVEIDIAKKKLSKPTVAGNATYTGDTITFIPNGFDANTMTISGNTGINATESIVANVALKDNKNYEWTDGSNAAINLSWSIGKANPSYTIPTNLTATIGDLLSSVVLPSANWSWVNPNESVGDVGSRVHKATYTPNESDRNNLNTINNIDVTILVEKRTPVYTAPSMLTADYNDNLSSVSLASGVGDGIWSWKLSGDTKVGLVGNNTFVAVFTPTNTSEYKVVEVPVQISVSKATFSAITVTNISSLSKVYDGQQIANPVYTMYINDNMTTINDGTVQIKYNWASDEESVWKTEKPTNAGSHKVKVCVTGSSQVFDFESVPQTFDITRADNAITRFEKANYEYLNEATIPVIEANYATGTVFTYSDSENGTFGSEVPTTVGTHYIKATIPQSLNYNEISQTISFEIEKRTLTLTPKTLQDISNNSLLVNYYEKAYNESNILYVTIEKILCTNAYIPFNVDCAEFVQTADGFKFQPISNSNSGIKEQGTTDQYYIWKQVDGSWVKTSDAGDHYIRIGFYLSNSNPNFRVETESDGYVYLTWNVKVAKAVPQIITNPTASTATANQTLSEINILGGDTNTSGTWSWEYPDTILTATANYNAIFTPNDTANYTTTMFSINVTVTNGAVSAPSVLEQMPFLNVNGVSADTFEYWTATKNVLFVGNTILTETQFNEIISNINTTYNQSGTPLSNWQEGASNIDTNNIPEALIKYGLSSNDMGYNHSNTIGEYAYSIYITAFKRQGTDTINVAEIYINAPEITNRKTFVNNADQTDEFIVQLMSANSGTVSWGELTGTFAIDLSNGDLYVEFNNTTDASGSVDMQNGTVTITYLTETYNFTETFIEFDVDLTTGADFKTYDQFSYFVNNKKMRLVLANEEEGQIIKNTITEWNEGNNKFLSFKYEIYVSSGEPGVEPILMMSYEEIYDIANQTVYFFETLVGPETKHYKTSRSFENFLLMIKEVDAYATTIMDEIMSKSAIEMIFGGFLSEPMWTEEDFTNNYSQTGRIKIDGTWYNIEGYEDNEGNLHTYMVNGEEIAIPFEGSKFISPILEFSDYSETNRAGYEEWNTEAFESLISTMYASGGSGGDSGGDEGGAISENYIDSNGSRLNLVWESHSSNRGSVTWGSDNGTFTSVEQATPSMLDITMVFNDFTINAVFDAANRIITFTHLSVSYTFNYDDGSAAMPTEVLQQYNAPVSFKAVWEDEFNNYYTIVKVEKDIYMNLNNVEKFYRYESENTYSYYLKVGDSWQLQPEAVNVETIQSELNVFVENNESLINNNYQYINTPATYGSFENCKQYSIIIGETTLSTIYLHEIFDFKVAVVNDSGNAQLEMISIDTSQTSFVNYGITNTP